MHYYVTYTLNPHLHSAHHNTKQGLYPVWMEEYTLDVCMHTYLMITQMIFGEECRE